MTAFKTIRQTAAMGILPENALRKMQKNCSLPGIQMGNRFMVNVEQLIAQLNEQSKPHNPAQGRVQP